MHAASRRATLPRMSVAVLRKTAKGQIEIETRVDRLPPRLRTALILVDGRRDSQALAALCPGDAKEALATLLERGYVEPVEGAGPAATPAMAAAAAVPAASAPVSTTADAPVPTASWRREVVRHLTDRLGPMADGVTTRIEQASSAEQLRPTLSLARQMLRDLRGVAAANEFERRFLDTATAA